LAFSDRTNKRRRLKELILTAFFDILYLDAF